MRSHPLRSLLAALGIVCLGAPLSAQAQAWPARQPIKLVAVFPPGGSVDQVARLLAQPLSQQLGQSVVVENKGGASGSIGAAAVAAAPADGYTFAVVFDTHGVNPSLIPGLPFDSRKDLTPLVLIGTAPMVLATHAGSEIKTFADAVSAAKTKKGVSYGTIGSGSLGHLAMALLSKSNSLDFQHIPYKGGGPLMNDVVAGHVPLSIGSVFLLKPHIDSKRLRPLAVTTSKRSADLPDVPTMAESGFAGFDAPAWWAVLAPARTPPDILKRMNEELNKVLRLPDVAKRLDAQGIHVVGGSADTARVFIEQQMDIWGKVVKDNNIKAD
ncbi:tripartite tricarboxylate transporter substrate binding protein [Rhodoferax sp.]|uniref:tripartite tricarboxylate transporter substrate binding protein n=1 Tax=Rhodoferax sp. TaxID=50421 RepID=UPI001ECA2B28|nr:tripartite tricarboxylate transporter substrate binding protein [Rhodoferax sp.]MBT9505299.1 tripartite tricarboxylate transporter substrate binding protein [Rhodoferax sp.]